MGGVKYCPKCAGVILDSQDCCATCDYSFESGEVDAAANALWLSKSLLALGANSPLKTESVSASAGCSFLLFAGSLLGVLVSICAACSGAGELESDGISLILGSVTGTVIFGLVVWNVLSEETAEQKAIEERHKDLQQQITDRASALDGFEESDRLDSFGCVSPVLFDAAQKQLAIMRRSPESPAFPIPPSASVQEAIIIRPHEIVKVELVQDNESVVENHQGEALTGALAGGILAGGAGAIIGSMMAKKSTSKTIKAIVLRLYVDDDDKPVFHIPFLQLDEALDADSPVAKASLQTASKWYGRILALLHSEELSSTPISKEDVSGTATGYLNEATTRVEQLERLAKLHTDGLISREEFELMKAEILADSNGV